jgi:hypothetical protein
MDNLSLSDIAAVTRDDDKGFEGGWIWVVILFLFVFMGGGGLWGNRGQGGCATTEDVQNQFNFCRARASEQ